MSFVGEKPLSDAFVEKSAKERETVEDIFIFYDKIGEGAYGQVFLVKPKNRNTAFSAPTYALKVTELRGHSAWREVSVLRELRHENIVTLHRAFYTPPKKMCLLLEYCEYDLWTIIHHNKQCKNQNKDLPVLRTMYKSIMHQILTGVEFLHQNLILHRDLKPGNVLVTGGSKHQRGRVKIADFGFARSIDNNLVELDAIDPVVVTLWYRAPELLLGAKHYSNNIDVWSIGCIFAELLLAKPIFINREENPRRTAYSYKQLHSIFSVMGLPTLDSWPSFPLLPNCQDLLTDMLNSQVIYDCSLERYLGHKNQSKFICEMVPDEKERKNQEDLLQRLLTMNPESRISCEEALQHSYFTSDPKPTKDVFADLTNIPYSTKGVTNEEKKNVAPQPQGNLLINQKSQQQGISHRMRAGQDKQSIVNGNLNAKDLLTGNVNSTALKQKKPAEIAKLAVCNQMQKRNRMFPAGPEARMNTSNHAGPSNIANPTFQSGDGRPSGSQLFPGNLTNHNIQATDASRMVSSQRIPYQQQNQPSQPLPAVSQMAPGVYGIGATAPPLNLLHAFQGFPAPGFAFPMQLDYHQLLQNLLQQQQLMFLQQQEQGRMVSPQEPPSKKPAHQENRKNHPF